MFESIIIKRLSHAEELYKKGNYKQAYKIISENCEKLPKSSWEGLMARYYLAEMNFKKLLIGSTYDQAEKRYSEILHILDEYFSEKTDFVNEIELKCGIASYYIGDIEYARIYLEGRTEPEALEILEKISEYDCQKNAQIDKILNSKDAEWLDSQGELYENDGDYKTALMCYERGAELNNGKTLIKSALMYIRGRGTSYDIKKALEYLKRATKTDERELAFKFLNGWGYEPEKFSPRELTFEERCMCLQAAIESGDDSALISIGNLYMRHCKTRKTLYDVGICVGLACTYYALAGKSTDPEVRKTGQKLERDVKKEFNVPDESKKEL